MVNQSQQAKLLSYGHKPVFLILSEKEFKRLKSGSIPVHSQKWQRIPADMTYKRAREGLCVAFEFTLSPEITDKSHILFAYSQPFTRTDIERSIDEFKAKCDAKSNEIYCHKEVLVDSLEGYPMHMLTVSGQN